MAGRTRQIRVVRWNIGEAKTKVKGGAEVTIDRTRPCPASLRPERGRTALRIGELLMEFAAERGNWDATYQHLRIGAISIERAGELQIRQWAFRLTSCNEARLRATSPRISGAPERALHKCLPRRSS